MFFLAFASLVGASLQMSKERIMGGDYRAFFDSG